MYGLHESPWANLLDFFFSYFIQNTISAIVLVTTPKRSPFRYVTILYVIWTANRFMRPFAPAGSPTWCQAICELVLVALQSINLLLIHPLDRHDISRIVKRPSSFVSNVFAASKIIVQTRGINTPWQVKNVPSHPSYYRRRGMQCPEKSIFLLRQAAIFFWQYLVLDIIQTITIENAPSHATIPLKPKWNVSLSQWLERGSTHLAIWFFVNRLIGDSAYRLLSIISVGLGIDSPSDWPPAFGSMSDAYTLRNFWGKFWHQFMRRPFTSLSKFITRDTLGPGSPSLLERYVNLFWVFLCSSLYHVIVDLLQSVPAEHSGSIPFFMAFVPAIMIEDCVQWLWKQLSPESQPLNSGSRASKPPVWQRALGFCWVMGWLAVSSTWYFTPMIQLTTKDIYMVPFSFCQKFGLFPIATSSVCSGVLLMYVFEIEL